VGVVSQSASGIPAGDGLITGGLCLRCKRESRCCQGFSSAKVRSGPSRPLNGYSQGNATLLRRNSDGMAVVQVGSTRYAVSSPFGLGTGDSTTTWQMLAAETVEGKNQIAWRNNSGNFLHVWSLDAGWNWQASSGNINPSSPEALALETSFQNDFNGNGVIG
jgi:hypothetical protein